MKVSNIIACAITTGILIAWMNIDAKPAANLAVKRANKAAKHTSVSKQSRIQQIARQKPTKELVYEACTYYGIRYARTVTAQSILETGHFTSDVAKDYNNLFGLYDSATNDYYRFNNWTESVKAYKDYVQCKFVKNISKYNSYYQFLRQLPYAEDQAYVKKVQRVEYKHLASFAN